MILKFFHELFPSIRSYSSRQYFQAPNPSSLPHRCGVTASIRAMKASIKHRLKINQKFSDHFILIFTRFFNSQTKQASRKSINISPKIYQRKFHDKKFIVNYLESTLPQSSSGGAKPLQNNNEAYPRSALRRSATFLEHQSIIIISSGGATHLSPITYHLSTITYQLSTINYQLSKLLIGYCLLLINDH